MSKLVKWKDYSKIYEDANSDSGIDDVAAKKKQKIRLSSLAGGQVRRVRMKNAFVESVDYLTVFEKNNWICQLCNRPVSKLRDKRLVDSASLDHIIPISKGGEHSYANTQLAHLSCNLIKGASTPKL
jgi:hypothetical protein